MQARAPKVRGRTAERGGMRGRAQERGGECGGERVCGGVKNSAQEYTRNAAVRRTAQCEGLRKKHQCCVGVRVMSAILQARAHRSVKRAPERGARGRVHAYAGQCRNKRECAGVSKDAHGVRRLRKSALGVRWNL